MSRRYKQICHYMDFTGYKLYFPLAFIAVSRFKVISFFKKCILLKYS